ncbi:hypothetical protein [Ectopseudomonas alcaliphila]|uniref:hypothetical protein n=1 Tax=Ectopseudomonas alcaliphila TaxID=101564 RepID=UPI0027835250|nr:MULTISPECIES: hypothetical protein [Pseudomonas]MDP9940660.1 Fe2+ transport system protein B [Pseudomonas sp. 3400]MDR7011775.1 Fe2+ transport system protein B [Pseudomonas alcaliphila]
MNTLYSILYMLAVIGLLLASVVLSETLYLRSPSGVLLRLGPVHVPGFSAVRPHSLRRAALRGARRKPASLLSA